jgi:hypothetical protein
VRRQHNQRLKNAKSKLNTSLGGTPSEKKSRSKTHKNLAPQSTLIYALLTNFNLQEYARGFVERGYGFDLVKFKTLDGLKRDELMTGLNVRPEDRIKMETLINYIRIMVANLPEKDSPHAQSTYSQ